jgi:hypothetical protein
MHASMPVRRVPCRIAALDNPMIDLWKDKHELMLATRHDTRELDQAIKAREIYGSDFEVVSEEDKDSILWTLQEIDSIQ